MEHTKKMVLVDPRMLQDLRSGLSTDTVLKHPEVGVIDTTNRSLDAGMREILERNDLHAEQKIKLYNNYLQQYLTMSKKETNIFNQPIPVTLPKAENHDGQPNPIRPNNGTVKPDPPNTGGVKAQINATVPKGLQKQAGLLFDIIKDDVNIDWNDRGELIVNNNPIQNSNVVDLVNDVIRSRKNFNPIGWEIFARKLYEINVPRDLIRNPTRLNYIQNTYDSPPPSPTNPNTIKDAIRLLRSPAPRVDKKKRRTRSASRWETYM